MRGTLIFLLSACSALSQTTYQVGTTPFTASSQAEGASVVGWFGKTNTLLWPSGDGRLRWNGNHSSIAATIWDDPGNAAVWCLYQDGVQVGSCYTAPTDNNWSTTPAWAGLSGTHLYELCEVQTTVALNNNRIAEVIVSGGTGLTGSKPTPLPVIAGCGDSIAIYISTQAGQNVKTDIRYGDYWLAGARSLGYVGLHWGTTGRMVSGANGLYSVCAANTNLSPAPKIVMLTGGVNDMDANVTVGTPHNGDPSTFEGGLYAEFTNVWANSPAPAKVFQRGILPNSYGGPHAAAIATWNGYEQAVVNQWNIDHPSTPVTFIDPTGWFDPVSDTSSDGLHPLNSGYSKMAAKELPIFQSVLNTSAAGQSLAIASQKFSLTDPNWAGNLPYRVEFQIHNWTVPAVDQNILSLNGIGFNSYLKATGTIQFQNPRDTMSPGSPQLIPPPGCSNIVVRAQRDPVAMTFSAELWCYDSTGYQNSTSTISSIDSWIYSGGVIGDSALVTDIGFVRVFTTLVPLGSRVPTTADGGDWTELKLDGNLNDSTGNGHIASGSNDSYVPTPNLGPVSVIKTYGAPFWSNQVSFRAGYSGQMDGTSSYSMAPTSSSVSYLWQALSCPQVPLWSSHTAAQPTLTGLVFGDCSIQLQVTDADNSTALSILHVGAVATDSKGVVVQANPQADQLFGPMIAYGKNPWQYQDYLMTYASTQQAAAASPPTWATPLSGTVSYWPFYASMPGRTTLNGAITSSALSLTVVDATKLDLTSFPTIIEICPPGSNITNCYMEEVVISGAVGNTLTVAYNGRGWRQGLFNEVPSPQAWASGSTVTQLKTTGTGTHFLTDFCPAGPGEEGQILYNTGTVGVTAGSTTLTGSGTTWVGTQQSYRLRIQGTHNGTPFVFFATINSVNSSSSITMSVPWPSDGDMASGLSYQILKQGRNIAAKWLRADSTTGQENMPLSACVSDTAIYQSAGDSISSNNAAQQVNQQYSYSDAFWVGDTGPNYYDAVLANYASWLRSGLNQFRDNARATGDHWATNPGLDEGYVLAQARDMSITGLVAAAIIDNTPGHNTSNNWYTIHNVANIAVTTSFSQGAILSACTADVREQAYGASWLNLSALFDPDPGMRAYWNSLLPAAFSRDNGCQSNGAFNYPQYSGLQGTLTFSNGSTAGTGAGIPPSLCNVAATGTITVTNGSSAATGTGFIPMPAGGQIVIKANYQGNYRLFWAYYTYIDSTHVTLLGTNGYTSEWQWDSGTYNYQVENDGNLLTFAASAADTSNLSQMYVCTWNSPTSITLDRNWAGASGAFNATRYQYGGYGSSPFLTGIKDFSMRFAAIGSSASAGNYATLAGNTAKWLLTNGFDPVTKGLYYGRVWYNCEPATPLRINGCSYGSPEQSQIAARTLNAEAQNAMGVAAAGVNFNSVPTTTNQSFGDQFYGGQWGAPGYGTPPYADGLYVQPNTWNYKWFGFLFGIGMSHQWPAVRLGGVAPVDMRTVNIPFSLSGVRNAAKVQITVMEPTGASAPSVVCVTSPCPVTVDGRIGSPLVRLDYLNSSDAVIAPGDTIPLYICK